LTQILDTDIYWYWAKLGIAMKGGAGGIAYDILYYIRDRYRI
jgi:hypothetical protein